MSRWAFSRQQVLDGNGRPYAGAVARFFNANTSTPLVVYADAALSQAIGSSVTADAAGRFPFVYLPYVGYREQVLTADGTQLWNEPNIDNPAPPMAAGGASSGLLATGDVIWSPQTGARSSYVRLNGRTIGNAASGATERANADCQALFAFLWSNMPDGLCPVSGGRGASALADFNANKTITLLDARGSFLAGLDDMGNAAASRLALMTAGTATQPGAVAGENAHALTTGELPAHTHGVSMDPAGSHNHGGLTGANGNHTHALQGGATNTGTAGGFYQDSTHYHGFTYNTANISNGTGSVQTVVTSIGAAGGFSTVTTQTAGSHQHDLYSLTLSAQPDHQHSIGSDGSHSHTLHESTVGGNTAHNNVPRAILGTWYQAL